MSRNWYKVIPDDAIVIDIRHPEEKKEFELDCGGLKIIEIPYYELSSRLSELSRKRVYLLVCNRWSMSIVQAAIMREQGFIHTRAFEPASDTGKFLDRPLAEQDSDRVAGC